MTVESEVKKIMTLHGFKFPDTGPIFTAYTKEESDYIWVVTSQEEPYHAPKRTDEPVLVCKYTLSWEYIEGSDLVYDSLQDYLDGKEGKVPSWVETSKRHEDT
jgi:hypothetical protein